MKNLLYSIATLLAVFAFNANAIAQIEMPAPSPGATLEQTVGLTDVVIEYSRPGVKDRVIFAADGLVPYGKMWRTGANAATKLTFSDDVMLGGKKVEAGSYAMLTMPNEDKWMIHLHPYESGSWSSYIDKDPAVALSVAPEKMNNTVETMRFDVNNITMNGATIDLEWADTRVSIPLEVTVDEKVMASIDRVLSGPSSNDYFAAASYLHESGKDLDKALVYINKATGGDDPKFWQVRRKALILADLGKKKEAIAAAKMSMELAEKAGNEDYVRMNKKSIEEWQM